MRPCRKTSRWLTRRSTRTHKCVRSVASLPALLFLCAGYLYVMPHAVVFAFSLLASLRREYRGSCKRFVVARTSQSLAVAVNRCMSGAVADRTSAFASRPVGTPGQAVGSAANSSRRQLLRPSRLPSSFCVFCTSSLRSSPRRFPWAAGASILAPTTRGRRMHNKSANTDPHLHKAASPQKVVVRLPLR